MEKDKLKVGMFVKYSDGITYEIKELNEDMAKGSKASYDNPLYPLEYNKITREVLDYKIEQFVY